MTIRMTGTYNLTALDDFENFVQGIDAVNQQILNEVRDEIAPDALQELSVDAPPVARPIQWTTPKQMRYYFGVVAKRDSQGNIIPYKRTGKLRNAWVVEVRGNAIVIENPSAISKFVYGSLAQNRSAALRFQQGFHANTGWQPATDTAKKHLDRANELYLIKFEEWLKDLALATPKRRAFTKGTRRR